MNLDLELLSLFCMFEYIQTVSEVKRKCLKQFIKFLELLYQNEMQEVW